MIIMLPFYFEFEYATCHISSYYKRWGMVEYIRTL